MRSLMVGQQSIHLGGRKTSVTLPDAFWHGLKEIAHRRQMTLSDLIGAIDAQRRPSNLSSAIWLFVLGVLSEAGCERAKSPSAQRDPAKKPPPTPRPRLPLLPARLELGLGLVQRRYLVRYAHAPRLAGSVDRPEPAQGSGPLRVSYIRPMHHSPQKTL